MPTITYVDDSGETVERELASRRVTFVGGDDTVVDDEFEFRPLVVERAEYDHEGQMSSITTVCGETENRRESDEKPKIIIEGVISEPQVDRMQQLRQLDQITLISDIFQGLVEIRRVTIEQSTDLIEVEYEGTTELAFGFQIQCREP